MEHTNVGNISYLHCKILVTMYLIEFHRKINTIFELVHQYQTFSFH